MASLFLNAASRDAFLARVNAIHEDTPRQWGTMDPRAMMTHLLHSIRASLEEVEIQPINNFLVATVGRFVAFHTPVPWPKGKLPTAPGFTPEPEGPFDQQKQALIDATNRFIDAAQATPDRRTLHHVFGKQPLQYWERLNGRHFDHHLRQFGV